MSDINDRLAALDPAAHDPYRARNLDQMISRIVASSPSGAARSAWWQRVQLRIAGTLILGTLVGAGTLAIVQGGTSLATLAIQTNVVHHPGTFAATENAAQLRETTFTPPSSLTSSGSSSPSAHPSYELSIPKDSAGEAVRLAAVFQVVGAVHRSGDDWTVAASSSGASFDYQTSGSTPQWYYSSTTPKIAPSTASSSTDVAMPSHAALNRTARTYLKQLGFHYSVTSPVYSQSTVSITTATGAPRLQGQEEVSYTVAVHGVKTDQGVSFSVDAHNTVVYAQGPAFSVSAGTNYPLQSPLEGVDTLNALERSTFTSSALGASAAGPASLHAKLASVSISLGAFRLKNGTSWLLPLYTYSGTLSRHTTALRTWSEIAIDPSYVKLSPSEARNLLNN
jgi:hypothetical protein